YGCVAGYPNGTFKGKQAMTRYEAAALLNACLDRVTEMTEELKRLLKEFEKEMAVLKAKVDGLEAKTEELAATQFSTTTKLKGQSVFWLGGTKYNGRNKGESPLANTGNGLDNVTSYSDALAANANAALAGGQFRNGFTSVPVTNGPAGLLTKGATWSGFGDSGLISGSGAPGNSLAQVTPGSTTGPLGVDNLRFNGVTKGSLGFKNNTLANGAVLDYGVVNARAERLGFSTAPISIGGFAMDNNDLANLVSLGNKARLAKGAPMIRYSRDIEANPYTVAAGGYFTNTNTYYDPFNLAIAEYGSLSGAQANSKPVKTAARKFLRDLYRGDVTLGEAVSFNYDVRLALDTSFTGKDLLRTRLRMGNFGGTTWAGNPYPATGAEVAFEEGPGGFNTVGVDRIFYQFPVGSNFTVTAGPRVRQDDMLAVWPSQYPADTILDFFTYAGSPGTYTLNLGAGAGIWWKADGLSLSANYVAANGRYTNSAIGGVATDNSASTGTVQLAYTTDTWNLTAAYSRSQNGAYGYIPVGTPLAGNPFGGLTNYDVNSVAISGYWGLIDTPFIGKTLNSVFPSGFLPSISAGWGINNYIATDSSSIWGVKTNGGSDTATSSSWYVGLMWGDAIIKGNTFGTAVGQPTYITSNKGFLGTDESTFAWEIWYKFQVTDNVSVTPAFFFIENPSGLGSNNAVGGVLKTTFLF
ncbi:MAG: iron uptake porin, partial [Synechococcus sp.]